MILTNPYKYPVLTRHDGVNGMRLYDPGYGRHLPSVTTILSSTADKSYLTEWRQNVGEIEANRVVKESTMLGDQMHDNLEHWILTKRKPEGSMYAKILTELIIKKGLSKVDEVWGVEVQLYYPDFWAGTTDLVGVWDGKLAIMDFKNARQHRTREQVEDYFLQLCAYAMAHNNLFGTNIRTGVIMMAVRDGKYLEFVLEEDEFDDYCIKWAKRVEEYYAKYELPENI